MFYAADRKEKVSNHLNATLNLNAIHLTLSNTITSLATTIKS